MAKLEHKLKRFAKFCQEKRIPKAIIKGIPYAGASFEELIYGDDLENLIRHVHEESLENQKAILSAITELMEAEPEVNAPVHVFGSANAEHIIRPEGEVAFGAKNNAKGIDLFGGGGLNYSSRLIRMDVETLPFVSVGEDKTGKRIQEYIVELVENAGLKEEIVEFVQSKEFCVPSATTSHATIIVQNSQRTIFSQRAKESHFYRHILPKRIKFAHDLGLLDASGVIIGHLSCEQCDGNSCSDTDCTETLINKYSDETPIIVNLGKSQLSRGYSYWNSKIKSDVIYQFNLMEAKYFFKGVAGDNPSLGDILHYFRHNDITAVITLDRFGAVANYKDGKNGVILAWPLLDPTQIVDPTGAGDAFAAGMMARLKGKQKISFSDFYSAIENGRNWAAYSCTTYGGSGDCPNKRDLDNFMTTYEFKGQNLVEFLNKGSADQIISLIDMAYR
jgi:sugar/nucleoside kinase (ribokinase family)